MNARFKVRKSVIYEYLWYVLDNKYSSITDFYTHREALAHALERAYPRCGDR